MAFASGGHGRGGLAGAIADALERVNGECGCPTGTFSADTGATDVIDWARSAGVDLLVTGYVPVGPTADWLASLRSRLVAVGVDLRLRRRAWDEVLWPYATKGFFPFKEKLSSAVRQLGID